MDGDRPSAVTIAGLLRPFRWSLTLRDRQGRALAGVAGPNLLLLPGRQQALAMLLGQLKPAAAYNWVEIGTSALAPDQNQTGCLAPVLQADGVTRYRVRGDWVASGDLLTLTITILGTDVQASVRETALFPSGIAGSLVALSRFAYPAPLVLTAENALDIVVSMTA